MQKEVFTNLSKYISRELSTLPLSKYIGQWDCLGQSHGHSQPVVSRRGHFWVSPLRCFGIPDTEHTEAARSLWGDGPQCHRLNLYALSLQWATQKLPLPVISKDFHLKSSALQLLWKLGWSGCFSKSLWSLCLQCSPLQAQFWFSRKSHSGTK